MILIGLGSNLSLGGRAPDEIVESAIRAISLFSRIAARSRPYRSKAWPDPKDPDYVNAVVRIRSDLGPRALLAALGGVEAGFGRRRTGRNAPRTLDLDLLDYDGRISGPLAPVLPHPGILDRDFVLLPLAEAAPGWIHPVVKKSVEELLATSPRRTAAPLEPQGPLEL